MARLEKSIEIDASPEKIWSLVNWDRVPEWYESIKKVEWKTAKGKMDVGATVHAWSETAGVKSEFDAEITEFLDKEKVTWRTTSGNPTIIFHATMNPSGPKYKVTTTFDYELPYSILGKLIDKLRVHKELEKEAEAALQRMKKVAEK